MRAPSVETKAKLTHSISPTLRPRSLSQLTCNKVAAMTTKVASSTGASAAATIPPETRAPKCAVANSAAQALFAVAHLNVAKNSNTGKKSKKIFMRKRAKKERSTNSNYEEHETQMSLAHGGGNAARSALSG